MAERNWMKELSAVAAKISDGHVSILKFTTNWRVWFLTPNSRFEIDMMPSGATFEEAAGAALRIAARFQSRSEMSAWEQAERSAAIEMYRVERLEEPCNMPPLVESIARAISMAAGQHPDECSLDGIVAWEFYIGEAKIHMAVHEAIMAAESVATVGGKDETVRH